MTRRSSVMEKNEFHNLTLNQFIMILMCYYDKLTYRLANFSGNTLHFIIEHNLLMIRHI